MEKTWVFLIVLAIVAVAITSIIAVVYFQRRKTREPAAKYRQALGDENLEAQASSLGVNTAALTTPQNTLAGRLLRGAAAADANAAANAAVDRHASVRSVMTLPAYRQSASHTEQVLGREGERDGIDTIVDLPTEEEHEALREDEMEAMYQIRVTRRLQIEEQQQRRAERRDARQRGDTAALANLRARTREANENNALESLRQELDRAKELRSRSVPIVSYADLGVARHDGTRIRANSNESERMGLLSETTTIDSAQQQQQQQQQQQPRLSATHRREASVSSVVSIDSEAPSQVRSHSTSGAGAGSSPELVQADAADEAGPPPEYEEVSLADEEDSERLRTSINEPPPNYPGPYRSASQRTEQGRAPAASTGAEAAAAEASTHSDANRASRPSSLRLTQLPEIQVQPSSSRSGDLSTGVS